MSDKKDPIGDALGLTPIATTNQVKDLVAKAHSDSAVDDFNMARLNIHDIIQNGSHAIEKLSQIADSSQHPRAFEVLAKLMETMLNANKDLMELQEKIRDIKQADEPHNDKAKQVTNNLFVGSTADLQKVLQDMRKNDTE